MSRTDKVSLLSAGEAALLTAVIGYYIFPGAAWSFYGVFFAILLAVAFPINLMFAALSASANRR